MKNLKFLHLCSKEEKVIQGCNNMKLGAETCSEFLSDYSCVLVVFNPIVEAPQTFSNISFL